MKTPKYIAGTFALLAASLTAPADTTTWNLSTMSNTTTIGNIVTDGIIITDSGTLNGTKTISEGSIKLGAGGITSTQSDTALVNITSSVELIADQTWASTASRKNSNGGAIVVSGVLSGSANITFDGHGLSDIYLGGNNDFRVGFSLKGTNTHTGTTTIKKSALLALDYSSDTGSKLGDTSNLIFAGGTLRMMGGVGVTESIGSTQILSGTNSIQGSGAKIALGNITRGVGGVLEIANIAGLASTTTQNTNGILGGWATASGATRWATGSNDGTATDIGTSYTGVTINTVAGWTGMTAATNANVKAPLTDVGSATANVVRIETAATGVSLANDATLTLTSGGIMSANTGQSITGGKIVSGMSTGELFVHAAQDFTIGSDIANNGATKTVLVKAGANALTLTGKNSYTGGTIINSGKLSLASGASLASANITLDGGNFEMIAGSSITFNVDGTANGTFDVFRSNMGTASLAGTIYIDFASVMDGNWQLFSLADADSKQISTAGVSSIVMTGAFANIILTNDGSGNWTAFDSTTNTSISFDALTGALGTTAIPEPATIVALLAVAVIAFAAIRRSRRA